MPNNNDPFANLSEEERRELKEYLQQQDTSKKSNTQADLSLISFLEIEGERQERLFDFIENKLNLLNQYHQSQTLIKQQKRFNEQLTEQLISLISSPDAPFSKSMGLIFDTYFQTQSSK